MNVSYEVPYKLSVFSHPPETRVLGKSSAESRFHTTDCFMFSDSIDSIQSLHRLGTLLLIAWRFRRCNSTSSKSKQFMSKAVNEKR